VYEAECRIRDYYGLRHGCLDATTMDMDTVIGSLKELEFVSGVSVWPRNVTNEVPGSYP
jgi:hypothetical protein